MIISFPLMGPYSQIIADGIKKYSDDVEILIPPPATTKLIERASAYLNELMCYPAKTTLANFISACEHGADKLIMFDSCGKCRLKTYWILQQRALDKIGFHAHVYPLRLSLKTPQDIMKVDSTFSHLKAWRIFIGTLRKIKAYDDKNTNRSKGSVRIGIVGEIFSVLEPSVNHNLFKKLEKLGASVHNSLPLSYFIFKKLYERGWMSRPDMNCKLVKQCFKDADKLFPKKIGGHGNESIIHTLYYCRAGFGAVIHVLPFACMPESTVAPIIDDICREHHVPVLRLIFDAHTGEAGLDTRLEALVDMLKRREVLYRATKL